VDLRLDNFERDEVDEYVRKRLGQLPPPPGLVDRIYQFSNGHPQVVSLAVDLAIEHDLNKPDLLDLFANLPPEHEHTKQLTTLLRKIIKDIEEKEIREALEIGWVVRQFDGDLLHFLLKLKNADELEAGEVPPQYERIIERLEQYSFTEHYPAERDSPQYWKFHDFIRRQMETAKEKESHSEVEELHLRTARYYEEKLKKCEEDDRTKPGGGTTYGCWYKYESKKWQSLKGEWLYHLSRASNRDAARLAFTRVYFDAFWWWGCYRPFPFCHELLKDWQETQTTPGDQAWIRVLVDFQKDYPTGYEKYGKGDWNEVKKKLVFLQSKLGLKRDLKLLNEDEQHTRAVLDLFLAHSFRYRDPQDLKSADQSYAEALSIFETLKDDWNLGWTLYEQGDLAMERGQAREALALTTQALNKAADQQDYELMGNCYRVRADVAWKQNRLDDAFANYLGALFYAYTFQGFPHGPDFYTRDFLKEMIERTQARLSELGETKRQAEAVQACEQMGQFWAPYWEEAGRPPVGPSYTEFIASGWFDMLTARLFPPLPTDDLLGNDDSEYVILIHNLHDEMLEAVETRRLSEDKTLAEKSDV
jgi:hypothetical protein